MEKLLDKVIYNSEAMQRVHHEIGPYVESAASLLFWGETGIGMGFLAKGIHQASGRSGKFLTIPGFSLDDDTVKQQFLGVEDRHGWLEEADRGTIFIKRISEMSPGVQHVIQQLLANRSVDGRLKFSRKGRTESLEVNVRFMFSMAHNLNIALQDELVRREAIEEMKRRGGKVIHVPPLRERKEDLLVIAHNFITSFNEQYQRHFSGLTESAAAIFTRYVWPGNVEELKQVIEHVIANHADIAEISDEHLPEEIINPKISGDKYRFKLKDDAKFVGKILSPIMKIESEGRKLPLNTGDIAEIRRIEDTTFAPPRFKHFLFRLKDGNQIAGKILDKKTTIDTSFDPVYQINPQTIQSVYLA